MKDIKEKSLEKNKKLNYKTNRRDTRNNSNSTSCNYCSSFNIGRNNNKYSI